MSFSKGLKRTHSRISDVEGLIRGCERGDLIADAYLASRLTPGKGEM